MSLSLVSVSHTTLIFVCRTWIYCFSPLTKRPRSPLLDFIGTWSKTNKLYNLFCSIPCVRLWLVSIFHSFRTSQSLKVLPPYRHQWPCHSPKSSSLPPCENLCHHWKWCHGQPPQTRGCLPGNLWIFSDLCTTLQLSESTDQHFWIHSKDFTWSGWRW